MKNSLLIFTASLLIAGSASANLLLNPSFEAGTGDDADNWTEFGNVLRPTWADKNGANLADDGLDAPEDYGMALTGWVDGGNGGFYQDVAGTPGLTYKLSGDFHMEPNFDATTYELKLEWLDAGSATISATVNNLIPYTTGSNPADGGEWTNLSVSGVAPAGTAFVRSTIFFSGTTDLGGNQAARIDNMDLVVVPEPASALLLLTGLGLIQMVRRKFIAA